nr:cytochrome c [Bradyrhizobium sp. 146]
MPRGRRIRRTAHLSAAARQRAAAIGQSVLDLAHHRAHTVTTPRAPNTGEMPAYSNQLSDAEIAAVTNYIRNSWGNAAPLVTPAQVARARKQEP